MTVNNFPMINLSGIAPQLSNLPEDIFDCDESQALATFAALCCSPNVKDGDSYLVSQESLALRQLALFAAGAQVFYHRNDFRDLEKLARGCANDSNHELVSWVLRAAYERAKSLGIVGPGTAATYRTDDPRTRGLAYIEPEDGRGYGHLAEDLDERFFADLPQRLLSPEELDWQAQFERWSPSAANAERLNHTRRRLYTYAAVMAALKPRLCHREVEAVVFLALYGADANVEVDSHQFDMLRMWAQSYIERMQCDRYANSRNRQMAEFAMKTATERARLAGITR